MLPSISWISKLLLKQLYKNTLNILSKMSISDSVIILNEDSLKRKEIWIETDKNQIISLCIEKSNGIFETELASRIESENCIQIKSPNLVGSSKVNFLTDNTYYTINLAVGMKYIDLSSKPHKIGYNGIYDRTDPSVILRIYQSYFNGNSYEMVYDSILDYKTRIYADPERIIYTDDKYLVDKYLVTQCEILQTLWDSIPTKPNFSVEKLQDNAKILAHLKKNSLKGMECKALDFAANHLSVYQMLLYANARSINDGLEAVYSIKMTDMIPSIPVPITKNTFFVQFIPFGKPYDEKDIYLEVTIKDEANGYRFPDYEEWYIFARGGDTTSIPYIWGNTTDTNIVKQYALYGKTKKDYENVYTATDIVGKLKPNNFGLYDMFGLSGEIVYLKNTKLLKRLYYPTPIIQPFLLKGGNMMIPWKQEPFMGDTYKNVTFEYYERVGFYKTGAFRLVRKLK